MFAPGPCNWRRLAMTFSVRNGIIVLPCREGLHKRPAPWLRGSISAPARDRMLDLDQGRRDFRCIATTGLDARSSCDDVNRPSRRVLSFQEKEHGFDQDKAGLRTAHAKRRPS